MSEPKKDIFTGREESLQDLMKTMRLADDLDSEAAQLIRRCDVLVKELDEFAEFLHRQQKLDRVEFRHFQKDVKKDISSMQKICMRDLKKPGASERVQHALRSSNLPFLEAVWAAAKRSKNVVGLKRHGQLVDVVADGGATWIKVSTISESRLLFEMAKQGWEYEAMSEGSDDEGWTPPDDEAPVLPLIKTAHSLIKASKKVRHKYRHPMLHLLFTRFSEGKVKEIDDVINEIRSLGISVKCANSLEEDKPLDDATLSQMVVDDFEAFSPIINVDCTVLLAIVSDISHQDVIEAPWFNGAIRRQIEIESAEHLLPLILWPAMGDRKLVCIHAASQRMREIVDTIGTETEKARTRLLMGDDMNDQATLIEGFSKLSKHSIPVGWQLPVRVISFYPENALRMDNLVSQPYFALGCTRARSQSVVHRSKANENSLANFSTTSFRVFGSSGIVRNQPSCLPLRLGIKQDNHYLKSDCSKADRNHSRGEPR